MIPFQRPIQSLVAALLATALLVSCGSDPGGPEALATGHPVVGGTWPPTTGDVWPSLAEAFEFRGCSAYGGVPVTAVLKEFAVLGVRSVSNLDDAGNPFIVIDPVMLQEHEISRRFLYYHECAHNMLQHPALRAIDEAPEVIFMEYDANCLAAGYLLRSELYTRQDINFMLLVLENNRGPDRPPFQAETLVQCLQEQGLY
jgi:hypothetical protein